MTNIFPRAVLQPEGQGVGRRRRGKGFRFVRTGGPGVDAGRAGWRSLRQGDGVPERHRPRPHGGAGRGGRQTGRALPQEGHGGKGSSVLPQGREHVCQALRPRHGAAVGDLPFQRRGSMAGQGPDHEDRPAARRPEVTALRAGRLDGLLLQMIGRPFLFNIFFRLTVIVCNIFRHIHLVHMTIHMNRRICVFFVSRQ